MQLAPGHRLGSYVILDSLGEGGMGHVYRARDERLDRQVALKVLRADWARDPEYVARFDREALMLAALNHPNIATLYAVEQAGDARFLVMELVPGRTLAARLRQGPLSVQEAVSVGMQLTEALEAAHRRGIIHRDLKPANVMTTPEGQVKVLDFGLAKAAIRPPDPTGRHFETPNPDQVMIGTPGYMAPEQARGEAVDARVDIWALGCILFEVLTGKRAFPGDGEPFPASSSKPMADSLHIPPDIPPRLAELLRRCLQRDPRKRLRDAGDARLELEEALSDLARGASTLISVPGTKVSTGVASRQKAEQRSRWWLLVAPVLLVGVALGLLLGVWLSPAETPTWSGQLLLGGSVRAYQPRVSPDGKWLAFVVLHEKQAQVGVMRLNSGEWWVVTRARKLGQVLGVCWSRDSARIYFDRFFDVPMGVFSVSPMDRAREGAREVPVLAEAESPVVLSDGSLLVCKLEGDGFFRMHHQQSDGSWKAVGPLVEFYLGWSSPVRALQHRRAVVFCGKVHQAPESGRRQFYLLDVERDEYRLLWEGEAEQDHVALDVAPEDDYVLTTLKAGDALNLVRFGLTGRSSVQVLRPLTLRPWGLEMETGPIYLDQIQRPLEVLRLSLPGRERGAGESYERVAAPSLWEETGAVGHPIELGDGRVVFPSKVAGRDRLMMVHGDGVPVPLLEGFPEETAPPITRVGSKGLAFLVGSGDERSVRLATLDGDQAMPRLEADSLAIRGKGITALAASPDGKTLYYVQNQEIRQVATDGSKASSRVAAGKGVAVYPETGELLIQQVHRGGVRLSRLGNDGQPVKEIPVKSGTFRILPMPIPSGAINQEGKILVATTTRDSFYWGAGVLTPDGMIEPVATSYDGDIYPAGWCRGNQVLAMGYSLRTELWRLTPTPRRGWRTWWGR
ncbi:MAG: serine/threonine-protein kinase [Gemmataceae bacterium]